jgi:hypothetical protein
MYSPLSANYFFRLWKKVFINSVGGELDVVHFISADSAWIESMDVSNHKQPLDWKIGNISARYIENKILPLCLPDSLLSQV